MSDNIVDAVDRGDFQGFLKHLQSDESILKQYGQDGRTVLHAVVAMRDVGAVASLFKRGVRPDDYFLELSSKLSGLWEKAARIQDNKGNTPIHVAIINDRLHFAIKLGWHAGFAAYYPKYVRNNDNHTELGLALALYGVHGRINELSLIFKFENLLDLTIQERLNLLKKHTSDPES